MTGTVNCIFSPRKSREVSGGAEAVPLRRMEPWQQQKQQRRAYQHHRSGSLRLHEQQQQQGSMAAAAGGFGSMVDMERQQHYQHQKHQPGANPQVCWMVIVGVAGISLGSANQSVLHSCPIDVLAVGKEALPSNGWCWQIEARCCRWSSAKNVYRSITKQFLCASVCPWVAI